MPTMRTKTRPSSPPALMYVEHTSPISVKKNLFVTTPVRVRGMCMNKHNYVLHSTINVNYSNHKLDLHLHYIEREI